MEERLATALLDRLSDTVELVLLLVAMVELLVIRALWRRLTVIEDMRSASDKEGAAAGMAVAESLRALKDSIDRQHR